MNLNPKSNCKVVHLLAPISVSSTQTLTNDVDCLGFTHALVIVDGGVEGTVGGDTLAVQMKETDTSGSAYSNISGALLTRTGITDGTTLLGEIYLQQRKRYLSCTATVAGSYSGIVAITVILFNPEDSALAGQTYGFQV